MDEKLDKYQIAAVTGGVPMTGDPRLDSIISASMRLRIATELMSGILASGYETPTAEMVKNALYSTDVLLKLFQEGTNNGEKTPS